MEADSKQSFLDLCCEAAYCEDRVRLDEIAEALLHILREESRRLEARLAKAQRAAT